ncbi:hypothetical protein [Vibrio owensii]|uniref:hypothetical protein n=1 Tax=Vibrio harveyi group TaxID=717610 RepID=UPI003CC628D6
MIIKVSPYVLRAIADFGMPDDYSSDEDWSLARDIEEKMSNRYYSNNKMVSGPYVSIELESRALELLEPRIREINREIQNREISKWIPILQNQIKTKATYSTIDTRNEFTTIKQSAEKIVRLTIEACVQEILAKYPDMPRNYKPKISYDWSTSRKTSWGGYNPQDRGSKYGLYGGVSMAMTTVIDRTGKAVRPGFLEYSHLQKSPIMGGFKTSNWKLQLMALAAHEVCHAMQFYYYFEITDKKAAEYKVAHGKGFQAMYSLVREKICNPRLKQAGIKIGDS